MLKPEFLNLELSELHQLLEALSTQDRAAERREAVRLCMIMNGPHVQKKGGKSWEVEDFLPQSEEEAAERRDQALAKQLNNLKALTTKTDAKT